MSGGAFDYNQWHIEDIANRIEEEIENQKKPEPPLKKVHYVSITKQTDQNTRMYVTHHCDTIGGAKRYLLVNSHIIEKDGHIIDKYDFWTDEDGVEHNCEYFITDGEYDEYEEGHDDCYYGYRYPEDIIEEFKVGVKLLRKAHVYAQRIDWLLSGDDGEESFRKRLKEDLEELE